MLLVTKPEDEPDDVDCLYLLTMEMLRLAAI